MYGKPVPKRLLKAFSSREEVSQASEELNAWMSKVQSIVKEGTVDMNRVHRLVAQVQYVLLENLPCVVCLCSGLDDKCDCGGKGWLSMNELTERGLRDAGGMQESQAVSPAEPQPTTT